MKPKLIRMGISLTAAVLGLVHLIPANGAPAVSVYAIPGTALRPKDFDNAARRWSSTSSEFCFDTSYAESCHAVAPIQLPQGAVIKSITAVVTDNGSGLEEDVMLFVFRSGLERFSFATMATFSTTGLPSSSTRRSLTKTSIGFPKIDNGKYVYSLQVRFLQGRPYLKYHGVKIVYE